jgi:protein disulfide-isomerase A6
LNGIVKIGAVDMTTFEGADRFGVTSYPTIKAYTVNKEKPVNYEDDRTAQKMAAFAQKEITNVIRSRLGLKAPPKKPVAKDYVDVNADTWDEQIMQSDEFVMVEFYAPWCGHCKNLAPEWAKAATQLKGSGVKLVAFDATIMGNQEYQTKYEVQSYPTVIVFDQDKTKSPEKYNGGRTATDIVQFARSLVEGPPKPNPFVAALDDATFDETVLGSKDIWIVEFFAPWCGHCKELNPVFAKSAEDHQNVAKFAQVDATANAELTNKYSVSSYPTLFYFVPNRHTGEQQHFPFNWRGHGSFKADARNLLEELTKPPRPVVQLTSYEVLEKDCGSGLCLVAFIPHLVDSGVMGREEYLEVLREQAHAFKNTSITLMWAEVAQHPKLELALECTSFPSVGAVSVKKGLYVPYVGTFTQESIKDFLTAVISGKKKTGKLKLSADLVNTVSAWNGQVHTFIVFVFRHEIITVNPRKIFRFFTRAFFIYTLGQLKLFLSISRPRLRTTMNCNQNHFIIDLLLTLKCGTTILR